MEKRTFKIIASDVGFVSPPTQYFTGKYPSSVAKKFGTKLFKLFKKDKIKVLMKETTRGSKKKIYKYALTFQEFDEPVEREINDNIIIYTGRTVVKLLDDTDPGVKRLYKKLKK